jgi:hypothetical protein
MNEEESLGRHGLRPADSDLDQIREMLEAQAVRESQHQGDGDTELMKLCCVSASAALDYLLQCEATGDFTDFSVENQSRVYSKYYLA